MLPRHDFTRLMELDLPGVEINRYASSETLYNVVILPDEDPTDRNIFGGIYDVDLPEESGDMTVETFAGTPMTNRELVTIMGVREGDILIAQDQR